MWHVGSSSLTRDRTQGPLNWELRVLATGPQGKSLSCPFLLNFLVFPDTSADPLNLREETCCPHPIWDHTPKSQPEYPQRGRVGAKMTIEKGNPVHPPPSHSGSVPGPGTLVLVPLFKAQSFSSLVTPWFQSHSLSFPFLPDNGACSKSSHDAGDDAEPGPGSKQPGEHPWRVQCPPPHVHRHPGAHVQCCQGAGGARGWAVGGQSERGSTQPRPRQA